MVLSFLLTGVGRRLINAVFARGLTALAGLALTVFLPFLYETEDVGRIYLVMTLASVFSIFARFGLDYKVNNALYEPVSDAASVKVSYFLSLTLYACVSAAVLYLLSTIELMAIAVSGLKENFFLILLLGVAYTISFFLFQLYKLDGSVVKASLSRGFLHSAVMLSGALVLSVLLPSVRKAESLNAVFLLVLFATILNVCFYIVGQCRGVRAADLKLPSGSFRLFAYSLLVFFISDVDYLFINYYLEASDLAVYATMKRLALVAAIFIDIGNLVLPKIFKDDTVDGVLGDSSERAARRISLGSTVLSFFGFLVVFWFGDDFIVAVWGGEYLSGHVPLSILMLSFSAVLSLGFSEVYLLLRGDQAVLLKSMLVAVAAVLIFNSLLVPVLGGVGAAISFMISSVIMRLILTVVVLRKYKVKLYAGWPR